MSAIAVAQPSAGALTEVHFAIGMPGFPELHRFNCDRWGGEGSVFLLLSSIEKPSVQFVATDPAVFFPDYRPDITSDTLLRVNATGSDEVVLLVILTLGERPVDATANLLGPLVVNVASREAVQAVLAGAGELTRAPLTSGRPQRR
jgi:flagellar assembly factor FliW